MGAFSFPAERVLSKSVAGAVSELGFQRLMEGMVRCACSPYWQIIGRLTPAVPLEKAA